LKVYKLVISLPFVSLPASDVKGDIEYGVKLMLALSKCSKKMLCKCRRQYLNSGTHIQKTNANPVVFLAFFSF